MSYLDQINSVFSGKGSGNICDLVKARHEREAREAKAKKEAEAEEQPEQSKAEEEPKQEEEPQQEKISAYNRLPIIDVFASIFGSKEGEAIYNAIPENEFTLEVERFVRNLASNVYYVDSCQESSLKRFREEDCEKRNIEEIRDILAETSSWSLEGKKLVAIVKLLYTAKFTPDAISEFCKILYKGIKESRKPTQPQRMEAQKPKEETPKAEISGILHEMCKDSKVKANLVTLLFLLEFDDDSRLSNVRKMDITKLSESNRIFLQRLTDITSSYSVEDIGEDEDFSSCGPVWVFSNMLKSSGSLLDVDKFAGFTIRKLSDMGYTFSEIIDNLRSIFPVINSVAFEFPETPKVEEESEQEENPDTTKDTEEPEAPYFEIPVEDTEINMNDIDTLCKALESLIPNTAFKINRVNDIEFTITNQNGNAFRLVMVENDPCILAVGTIDGQDITIPVSIGYDGIVRNMLTGSRYVLTQEEIETLQKEGIDPRIMAFLDVEGSASSIEESVTEEETLQFNRVLLNIGFKLASMFGKVPMLRIKSFDTITNFVMVSNGAEIRHPEFNTGIAMSGINVSVDGNKVRISYKGKATKFEVK